MSPFSPFTFSPFSPFTHSPFGPFHFAWLTFTFHPFHLPSLCLLPGWPGLTIGMNRCILKFIIWPYSFSHCHIFTVFTFHPFQRFHLSPFHRFHLSPLHLSPLFLLPGWPGLTIGMNRCILKLKMWLYSFLHLVTFSPFSPFTFSQFSQFSSFSFSPFHPFYLSSLCLLPRWPGLARDTNCCILKFKIWLCSSPFHRFHLSHFHSFSSFSSFTFSPFHPFHLSSLCLLPSWPGLTRDTNCCILKFKIWSCHILTVFTFHLFTFFTVFTFSPFHLSSSFHPISFCRADQG